MGELSKALVVDVVEDATGATVRVEGELDLATAPDLRRCLQDLLERGRGGVGVDLSAVTFMDSTALAVLVDLYQRLGAIDRQMSVGPTSPTVERLLMVTGLAAMFSADPSLREATTD